MMKVFFIVFVMFLPMVACASNAKFNDLRNSLSATQSETADEEYTRGLDAYRLLLDAGKPGYKVLCESWLGDNIPESNWLSWSYDLSTRFPEYQEKQKRYFDYFSQRLESDENFSLAAVKKLVSDKSYDNGFLLTWLRGEKGYRSVAYRVLKERYSSLPEFEAFATNSVRREQVKAVEKYINENSVPGAPH